MRLTINYGKDANGNPIAVTAQDKVYNGTTSDIIDDSTGNPITPVLSQLLFPTTDEVVGDKVTLVQGSVNFTNSNVGTWPVIFSGFSISGADTADYALTLPTSSTTASITKATLVITATPQTQTYGFGGTSARARHHRLHGQGRDPRHQQCSSNFHRNVRQRFNHLGDPVHQGHV